MKTKKQYKTSLPHCLLFFLSPNIPSLSTNPRGGEPGPLNQDEPHDSGFYSCAMPRGARAPESGDRRGVDAKPSPCRCVGIIAEKNSTSYGERRPSRPGLFWALFALVSLLLLVCRECIIETDAPSASLLNRVGSGLPLSLASLSMSSFRLSTTRKTIFDPDLQLVSFFPTKKKKMKNTKTRQLLARASSSSSASPAGDDSLPSSSSSPESMNINAAAADDLTISLFKRKRRRRADWSLGPALDLSPDDALRMQMDALRDNDAPYRDHGVEVLYRFADIDPFARSSYSGRSQDLGQFEVRSMFWGARNGASCGDGGGETARRRRAPRVIASFAIGDSSLIPDRISRGKRPSSKKKNSPSFNNNPAPPPPSLSSSTKNPIRGSGGCSTRPGTRRCWATAGSRSWARWTGRSPGGRCGGYGSCRARWSRPPRPRLPQLPQLLLRREEKIATTLRPPLRRSSSSRRTSTGCWCRGSAGGRTACGSRRA